MSHPLVIEPYHPRWPLDFATEAMALRAALGPGRHTLHHIGSTSVPGLHAKPIIDILAEVPSLPDLDLRAPAIATLGYEPMGEFGIPGRRFFRKNNAAGHRTHHLHAFVTGSPDLTRHLSFRDYLRAHPDAAQAYAALKLRLFETTGGNLDAYIQGKDAFVKDLERQALAWAARR